MYPQLEFQRFIRCASKGVLIAKRCGVGHTRSLDRRTNNRDKLPVCHHVHLGGKMWVLRKQAGLREDFETVNNTSIANE